MTLDVRVQSHWKFRFSHPRCELVYLGLYIEKSERFSLFFSRMYNGVYCGFEARCELSLELWFA
jgi:hypothetical protein